MHVLWWRQHLSTPMFDGGAPGLADPGPVAAALWTDPELEAGVCLDGVVTVVDARHISRQLVAAVGEAAGTEHGGPAAVNEAQRQIAYADVVLLNKVQTFILAPGQKVLHVW